MTESEARVCAETELELTTEMAAEMTHGREEGEDDG